MNKFSLITRRKRSQLSSWLLWRCPLIVTYQIWSNCNLISVSSFYSSVNWLSLMTRKKSSVCFHDIVLFLTAMNESNDQSKMTHIVIALVDGRNRRVMLHRSDLRCARHWVNSHLWWIISERQRLTTIATIE